MLISPRPAPSGGALRPIVTNVGAGCDGRKGGAGRARPVRTAKSCGPDLPTLGSSRRKMIRRRRWLKSPVHRGEREISRKTIAQGMSDRFDVPVVTNACAFYTARAATGAPSIRHSLRPPYSGRHELKQNSGAFTPRERERLCLWAL
jgi:hypothetical protein